MAIGPEYLVAEDNVIQQLYAAGFIDWGRTDINVVDDPVQGQVRLGDRKRYVLPDTNVRATVGPYTTCFYTVDAGVVSFIGSYQTAREGSKIRARIVALTGRTKLPPAIRYP